jgi:hypothetical protein
MPSVTQALRPFSDYENIPRDVLEQAAIRGTRRHAACSSIALRVPILHKNPDDAGYIRSFSEWFSRYVVRTVLVSKRLYDPALNFNGEPDFLLEVVPMIPDLHEGDLVVVDLKPEWTQPRPAWRAQVAAYLHLAKENRFPVKMGATLHPDQDGGPAKLEWCEQSPRDFAAFLNCLSAWNFFCGGKNAKEA